MTFAAGRACISDDSRRRTRVAWRQLHPNAHLPVVTGAGLMGDYASKPELRLHPGPMTTVA
jgi:hypothetical protein